MKRFIVIIKAHISINTFHIKKNMLGVDKMLLKRWK